MFYGVNILAVLAATLSAMVLGFIWYGKFFLGTAWMREAGLREEDIKPADAARGFAVSIVISLVQCILLAWLMKASGQDDILGGLCLGAVTGIGFAAFTLIANDRYEQRSFRLSLINAGYRSLQFTIAGFILGAWS